jgi:hypothetical protein
MPALCQYKTVSLAFQVLDSGPYFFKLPIFSGNIQIPCFHGMSSRRLCSAVYSVRQKPMPVPSTFLFPIQNIFHYWRAEKTDYP